MNSLAYLSRQLDVFASSSTPRTPPSTPTLPSNSLIHDPDAVNPSSSPGDSQPALKRVKTWSTREILVQGQGQAHSRLRKRSCSTPATSRPSTSSAASRKQFTSTPSSPKNTLLSVESAFDRLYIVRVFVALYQWVCAAWAALRRRGLAPTKHVEEDAETDEKETDDEGHRLIVPIVKPPTTSIDGSPTVPPLLPSHIPTPSSPLSKLAPPPTAINTDPIDSSLHQNLLPNPLPPQLFPSSPSTTSSTVSQPAAPAAALSAPKTPFHLPKTLVLDLDETLIHSTTRPMSQSGSGGTNLLGIGSLGFGRRSKGAGHMVEVVLGGRSTLYHVYKRPFVDYFLRKVSGWYTLVIFTASMQEYADPVIDWLDAGRGILARRLFRESCTQLPNGSYTKDLSIIEEDLARVCLVDNSPISYSINQANGIPIEGWTHDPADEALLDLLPVLDSLRFTSDVRRVLGIRGFS